MAVELFNSLGGYSVGIPPVPVVDGNGNVITNVLTTGNVSANTVYATYYKYANGQPFTPPAAGSNTQLQFNNNGLFGGIPNVTWNGNILTLGDITALSIGGGDNGYFLQTDGAGNLTWAAGGGGGGNGTPGGANTQVQYNDAGTFGGDAGFVYNNNTNQLSVSGNISAVNFVSSGGNVSGVNVVTANRFIAAGNISGANVVTANTVIVSGNITGSHFIGNGYYLTDITSSVANTVSDNAQPNITSVGTLLDLSIAGNAAVSGTVSAGNLISSGTTTTGNLAVSVRSNFSGNLNGLGNVNFATSPNVSLGSLSNIHINGGLSGYVLTTDGVGNLSWAVGGGGGNGTPGGNSTQVQYNDSGDFAGSANFTYNQYSYTLAVDNFNSNTVAIGSNLTVNSSGNLRSLGTLFANGVVNMSGSANINLGLVSHLHVQGGTNGQLLQTDGNGNLSWSSGGGGGNGVPGGSNTQVQFNDNGTFGGSPYMTFDTGAPTLTISGNLVANSLEIGSGAYKFSKSNVYMATTSTVANTVLLTFPANSVSGLDFVIIGTNATNGNRQISKVTAVFYDATVNYTEFSTLIVNGPVGNFQVAYDPGNVIVPASAILSVLPQTASLTTYKMEITAYAE